MRKSRTNLDYLVRIWIGEIELDDVPRERQVGVMTLGKELGLAPIEHDTSEILHYFARHAENGLRPR